MRIVVVHHALDWGGSARAAVDLANHWAGAHDVVLPALTRTGDWHYELDDGVEPIELTTNATLERSFKVFVQSIPKLRRLLRRTKPSAVVAIGALPNFAAMASIAGLDVPLILSERADPRVMEGRRFSVLRNVGYRFRRPDAMVMLTEDAADVVRAWMDARRVHVVPNPAPETSARRPRGGTASDTVIAVGRLVPQKGFDMLLDAWAQILGEHPGWRLRIVGEGASRPALEAQVRRLGIAASVDMPGFDPAPFEAMAASELYAFTSRYEGFAHVLVEAMACGLPVAAMDCPSGPRGIVRDGIDGFITPALDVAAFAGAMSRLMGDPALRDEMGANALQVGERFGAAAIWAQWDEILDETLASRRSAG